MLVLVENIHLIILSTHTLHLTIQTPTQNHYFAMCCPTVALLKKWLVGFISISLPRKWGYMATGTLLFKLTLSEESMI